MTACDLLILTTECLQRLKSHINSFQEKRKLEEKIESLEMKLIDKERAIEELDEKLRSERTRFEDERGRHTQVFYAV